MTLQRGGVINTDSIYTPTVQWDMATVLATSSHKSKRQLSELGEEALQAVWERVREHGLKVSYIDLYNTFRRYDKEGVEWAHFDPDVLDYGSEDAFWETLNASLERLSTLTPVQRAALDRIEEVAHYLASIGAYDELEKMAEELESMGERRLAERVRAMAARARESAVKPAVLTGRRAAIAEAVRSLTPGKYTFQELLERVNRYLVQRGYRPTNAVGLARVLKAMGIPFDKRRTTVYVLGEVEKGGVVALAA